MFQTTGRQESSSEGPLELSDEPAPRRCSRRVQGLWKPCCYISGGVLDFPAALVTRTEGGLHGGYPSPAGVCRRVVGLGGHGLDHRYRSSLSPRRRRRRGTTRRGILVGIIGCATSTPQSRRNHHRRRLQREYRFVTGFPFTRTACRLRRLRALRRLYHRQTHRRLRTLRFLRRQTRPNHHPRIRHDLQSRLRLLQRIRRFLQRTRQFRPRTRLFHPDRRTPVVVERGQRTPPYRHQPQRRYRCAAPPATGTGDARTGLAGKPLTHRPYSGLAD